MFQAFYFECPECGPVGMATNLKDGLPLTVDHKRTVHPGVPPRQIRMRIITLTEPDT